MHSTASPPPPSRLCAGSLPLNPTAMQGSKEHEATPKTPDDQQIQCCLMLLRPSSTGTTDTGTANSCALCSTTHACSQTDSTYTCMLGCCELDSSMHPGNVIARRPVHAFIAAVMSGHHLMCKVMEQTTVPARQHPQRCTAALLHSSCSSKNLQSCTSGQPE